MQSWQKAKFVISYLQYTNRIYQNNSPPPQSVRSHRRAPLFRKGGRRIQGPPADKRGEHCPFWDQRQKGGKNAAAGCKNRGKQGEKPVARALVERGRQQVPPSPPPQPIMERLSRIQLTSSRGNGDPPSARRGRSGNAKAPKSPHRRRHPAGGTPLGQRPLQQAAPAPLSLPGSRGRRPPEKRATVGGAPATAHDSRQGSRNCSKGRARYPPCSRGKQRAKKRAPLPTPHRGRLSGSAGGDDHPAGQGLQHGATSAPRQQGAGQGAQEGQTEEKGETPAPLRLASSPFCRHTEQLSTAFYTFSIFTANNTATPPLPGRRQWPPERVRRTASAWTRPRRAPPTAGRGWWAEGR